MGASTFYSKAKGKDAAEAFRHAVDAARYEHGHGGYTGTVAEKSDFVVITDTKKQVLETLRGRLAVRIREERENKAARRRGDFPPHDEWPSVDAMKAAIRDLRKSQRVDTVAVAIARALIDSNDPRVSEKWGPAGAVRMGRGLWLFFGWASD